MLFTATNLFYALNISEFYNLNAPSFYTYISLLLVSFATISIGISLFSYFSVQQKIPPVDEVLHWRLARIISDAVFQQKKLFVAASAIYAIVFALLDGILVYQPQVNFGLAYFVSGPTWRMVTCCGNPGYVPVGLFYLPAQHIGVELFPLSIFLLLVVSLLVGANVSLLVRAFRLSRTSSAKASERKGVMGSVFGAAFGLFAGCPTCAAAFFLSMIAGTGATGLSSLIAEYQPLVVGLTLPLLSFAIYSQARSIGTILKGCDTKVVAK